MARPKFDDEDDSIPDHLLSEDEQTIAWVDDEYPEYPIYIGERGGPVRLNAGEAERLSAWLAKAARFYASTDADDGGRE